MNLTKRTTKLLLTEIFKFIMLIAVDFDGTIVTHEYPRIGKEIPFAIDTLKRLQQYPYYQLVLNKLIVGILL